MKKRIFRNFTFFTFLFLVAISNVNFLYLTITIRIHLIYKHYVGLKNSEDFKSQKEIIIQMALVFIINKWCNRIEEYIQKLNTTSVKISKDLFADYQEFVRSDGFINNFFNTIYVN